MAHNELFLGLARCPFLSCGEKAILANKLDTIRELTVLSIEDICMITGRATRSRSWNPAILQELVERDINLMDRCGISHTSYMSPDYPPLLREIHDPPFIVFWKGVLPNPEKPIAAMVGTRMPSGDGAIAAARIGREFADAGVPVISGLARGIDAFAHRGNIEGGAPSVAVLACGAEQIYPRSNVRLAQKLLQSGGCIVSEYPPGDSPLKYRFPQRNRIISGFARAVLVVEAPEKSGALITADFALEQGRDLYVYQGTLNSRRGMGTKNLYEQGACAVTSAREILESWMYPERIGMQLSFEFKRETDPLKKCGL